MGGLVGHILSSILSQVCNLGNCLVGAFRFLLCFCFPTPTGWPMQACFSQYCLSWVLIGNQTWNLLRIRGGWGGDAVKDEGSWSRGSLATDTLFEQQTEMELWGCSRARCVKTKLAGHSFFFFSLFLGLKWKWQKKKNSHSVVFFI